MVYMSGFGPIGVEEVRMRGESGNGVSVVGYVWRLWEREGGVCAFGGRVRLCLQVRVFEAVRDDYRGLADGRTAPPMGCVI